MAELFPWASLRPAGRGRRLHEAPALAPARLSFNVSTTFLSFCRAPTPQFLQKYRESSSHRPRRGSKGQVLSASFWGFFILCVVLDTNPDFLRCGSGFLARAARDFSRNWTILSRETQNCARPYNTVARGSSPSRNFRRLSAFRQTTATFGKTFAKVLPDPITSPPRP